MLEIHPFSQEWWQISAHLRSSIEAKCAGQVHVLSNPCFGVTGARPLKKTESRRKTLLCPGKKEIWPNLCHQPPGAFITYSSGLQSSFLSRRSKALQLGVHDRRSWEITDPEESLLPAAVAAKKLTRSSCYSRAHRNPCKAERRKGEGETIRHSMRGRGSAAATHHNSETSYAKHCPHYGRNQSGKQYRYKTLDPRENAFSSPSVLCGHGFAASHSRRKEAASRQKYCVLVFPFSL